MATVRFSNELKENIISNAKSTFNARHQKAAAIPDGFAERVYNDIFRDHLHTMSALPDGFLDVKRDFSVTIADSSTSAISISLRLATHRQWPERINLLHAKQRGWQANDLSYLPDLNTAEGADIHNIIVNRHYAIKQVDEDQRKFVEGVEKICETFATLAPALKAWPPLWDLLPQSAKDRHLEVTERKAAAAKVAELTDELNLASMTATVVASKLVR